MLQSVPTEAGWLLAGGHTCNVERPCLPVVGHAVGPCLVADEDAGGDAAARGGAVDDGGDHTLGCAGNEDDSGLGRTGCEGDTMAGRELGGWQAGGNTWASCLLSTPLRQPRTAGCARIKIPHVHMHMHLNSIGHMMCTPPFPAARPQPTFSSDCPSARKREGKEALT